MRAVILAAGISSRLGQLTSKHPKSLLRFGSQTLIQRHLEHLEASSVEDVTIVVGYFADQIKAHVAEMGYSVPVRFVLNPRYREGSSLSLLAAAHILENSTSLVMDADILCGEEMFSRLIRAPFENCLLADGKSDDTGEEVKVVVREDGRVWNLAKIIDEDGTLVGESVGIFKFSFHAGKHLVELLRSSINENPDSEYESVIDKLLKKVYVGYEPVDDLRWTEIDFQEDVERARTEIYPYLNNLSQVKY